MALQDNSRLLGGLGILGALTLFIGDVLLFGYQGSGANFREGLAAAASTVPVDRLFLGGLLGPIGAVMCLAGFYAVWRNVSSSKLARVMAGLFALFAVSVGAFHLLCTSSVLALKFCNGQTGACADLLSSVRALGQSAYLAMLVPGALAFVLLGVLTATGKANLSRWTILANPLVLLAFSPLLRSSPAPVGAVLVAGSASLSLLVFFVVASFAARSGG